MIYYLHIINLLLVVLYVYYSFIIYLLVIINYEIARKVNGKYNLHQIVFLYLQSEIKSYLFFSNLS